MADAAANNDGRLTPEDKLAILKQVKDLTQKNYQNLSTEKDLNDADGLINNLNKI
jgi:hypothetical protein